MNLTPLPVRYAVARSGESWPEVTLDGLEPNAAGDLMLRSLPGLAQPSMLPPIASTPSGLALDCECGLYIADAADDRIVRIGLDCSTGLPKSGTTPPGLPGMIIKPAALCWGPQGWLFAANGSGQILVFTTPGLALRDSWSGFQQPAHMACHDHSVLVVDSGAKRLLRFDARGVPDATFNTTLLPPNGPPDPGAVAVAEDGTVYVADAVGSGIWQFSWSGMSLGTPLALGNAVTAMAISDGVMYVADATSGEVRLFSLPHGNFLGSVGGFQGPVTALAVGDRRLFIKPGLDASCFTAAFGACYRASGSLLMGPMDAGQQSSWARAEVLSALPQLSGAELAWYSDSNQSPAAIKWQIAPSLDVLLSGDRYLWLRVTLTSRSPDITPTLRQVKAQTAGGSYLDYLPYVYSRDPDRSGLSRLVLEQADPGEFEPGDLDYLRLTYSRTPPEGNQIGRLLDLARSQLGELEQTLDDLPRNFDPATAPAELLDWLSSWLGFDLPPRLLDGKHPDEVRTLLLGLAVLYRRRGTREGVVDFVEAYAGVRPHIVEDFLERPLWILGETGLGFGTGMPDRNVEGFLVGEAVVGETGPEDPATIGSALFASTAHRFSVVVPPTPGASEAMQSLVAAVVEAEKPAHTAFHICFAAPRLLIGIQARVGVDALVAAGPAPLTLESTSVLGLDARLDGPDPHASAAVGVHGQVGIDTRLG
jgi:phage tail-like protein